MTETAADAPLPYRARPPQVLLTVGAVLVVSAAAAVVAAYGGPIATFVLLHVAVGTAALSVWAEWERGLHSTAETLAACAVGLGLNCIDLAETGADREARLLGGSPVGPAVLAGLCLAYTHLARSTAAWPLAAWGAAQLAVLRGLEGLPPAQRTEVLLAVALVGLAIAWRGRPLVARAALVTTVPWWIAGVAAGSTEAWQADAADRWTAALLVLVAAAGLVALRRRPELRNLLGPPSLVPGVSGAVAGAAVTGAVSSLGTWGAFGTAYAGVWVAILADPLTERWGGTWLRPAAISAGWTMALLGAAYLAAEEAWPTLSLLLLLVAAVSLGWSVARPDDRHATVPTAVLCGAGAALLALPQQQLEPATAAVWLTLLYAVAMGFGAELEPAVRRATAVAAAVTAGAALLLLAAQPDIWILVEGEPVERLQDYRVPLGAHLAVQGLFTLAWAGRSDRNLRPQDIGELRPEVVALVTGDGTPARAWRIGAAQLVVACWIAAAAADLPWVEAYTLPAAVGLLLGAAPRLEAGPSWPAWGPALLVAFVPTTAIAVVAPHGVRTVAVLIASSIVMVVGARLGIRAPLLVGAGCALAIPFGLAVQELPWPLGIALLSVGALLLAVGARRERRPIDFFGLRLAELR